MIARKIKLKLNKKHARDIKDLSLRCATLYNILLSKNFELLDNALKPLSAFDMNNMCRQLKLAPHIGTDVVNEICKRVFQAIKRWLESDKIKLSMWLQHGEDYRKPLKAYLSKAGNKLWGRPRYKTNGEGISIQFPLRKADQNRVKVFGSYTSVTIPLIGTVKGFNDRQPLVGLKKIVTISIDTCGDYWATVVCDGDIERPEIVSRSEGIGVDLGLKHTVTAANQTEVIQPERDRFLDKQIENIRDASRKRKRDLPFIHRKIARRRKHSHHVMAKRLCEAANNIYVGNLNSRFLFAGRLARSASDAAHSQFLSILSYKAENAGKKAKIVNEAYTSQTCYKCGKRRPITLAEREFVCPHCGYSNDRDVNGALNILSVGERQRPELIVQSSFL
jgi:IS605 OrfB family transposase